MKPDADICIRKVRILGGRARKKAEQMNLDENDLVIVRTIIDGGLPEYDLEKVEGNPIEYLQRNLK